MSKSYEPKGMSTQTAGAAISNNRLVKPSGTSMIMGTSGSTTCLGVSGDDGAVANGASFKMLTGEGVKVTTASPIPVGSLLKCADNGRVTALNSADNVAKTIVTSGAGAAFANQPAGDAIDVVSASASDTTQTVTIIGTTQGGVVVVSETVTLTGTDAVTTTKTDWGIVLAVKKSAATVGTITIREASADQAITTLTAAVLSKGWDLVTTADQAAFNTIPTATGSNSGTSLVGIKYLAEDGTTYAYQAVALNGTTAALFAAKAILVTEVYYGAPTTVTATIKTSATEDSMSKSKGQALEAATAADQTIKARIN